MKDVYEAFLEQLRANQQAQTAFAKLVTALARGRASSRGAEEKEQIGRALQLLVDDAVTTAILWDWNKGDLAFLRGQIPNEIETGIPRSRIRALARQLSKLAEEVDALLHSSVGFAELAPLLNLGDERERAIAEDFYRLPKAMREFARFSSGLSARHPRALEELARDALVRLLRVLKLTGHFFYERLAELLEWRYQQRVAGLKASPSRDPRFSPEGLRKLVARYLR